MREKAADSCHRPRRAHHASRYELEAAERAAIRAEHPLHNIAFKETV